jgi:hypothetical protein
MTSSGVFASPLNVIASQRVGAKRRPVTVKQSSDTHAAWIASSQGLLAMTNLRVSANLEQRL